MSAAELRRQYIALACQRLDPASRFHAEDRAAIERGARFKTADELRESMGRIRAVARTTQAEMRRHCQI